MLTVNSSNEYQVGLSMYKESIKILDSVMNDMFSFFNDLGYSIVIYYEDDYKEIVVRELKDQQLDKDHLSQFEKRFGLYFKETTYTHMKDTMVGKYDKLCYYHFKPQKVVK